MTLSTDSAPLEQADPPSPNHPAAASRMTLTSRETNDSVASSDNPRQGGGMGGPRPGGGTRKGIQR